MFAPLNITSREKELHYVLYKDVPITSLPMHWHSEYELTYASKGSFRCLIDSVEYKVEEGNAILTVSGDRHYFFPSPDCTVTRILFAPSLISGPSCDAECASKVTARLKSSSKSTAGWPEDSRRHLQELIAWVSAETVEKADPAYILGASGSVLIILSLFLKMADDRFADPTSSPIADDRVMERIEKVFALVSDSYDKEITLSSAAETAGYVPTYFSRIFREYTGMTFYSYLTMYRLAIAEYKLVSSDMSINDIALSSGFGSVKTFDRIFKEKLSTSPLKYRKQIRNRS